MRKKPNIYYHFQPSNSVQENNYSSVTAKVKCTHIIILFD